MAETEVVTPEMEKRRKQRQARAKKAAPRAPSKFRYGMPEGERSGKTIVNLGQTDVIRGLVQVVKQGEGDNNLHIHTGMDSLWFVLKGRVRFYGPDDEVIGEFGQHEGLIMPRNNAYWFASTGDEDLELLQSVGFDRDVKNERIDVEPQVWKVKGTQHLDGKVD
ncbi:MAG: cupin domain-containing protein [Alphaproteobacteria bacterium]